jgi:chemotaxis protein CheX
VQLQKLIPPVVSPRSEWPVILRDVAIEAFSMLVGASLLTPELGDLPEVAEVTGMVGIAGHLSANLSLCCSLHTATKIASQMLGVSPDVAERQRCDAIGEICNVVAGSFKAKIGLGDQCMLSVPTVLTGKDYQIRSRSVYVRVELLLIYENEPIWIALDIRQ